MGAVAVDVGSRFSVLGGRERVQISMPFRGSLGHSLQLSSGEVERVRRDGEGCRSQVGDTLSSACRYARGTRLLGVESSLLEDRWPD